MVTFPDSAHTASVSEPHTGISRSSPARGTELLLALDTLEAPFAFLDRAGGVRHASLAFRRLVEDDERSAGLADEVRRFARALWGVANVRRLEVGIERLECRSLCLERGECRLQGTFVGTDLFGAGASMLVAVRLPPEDPYSAARLGERFGLTRTQSRVARLLAEGLRNAEIARQLFISPHTARHHVEQIRCKVGGHTRAAVAARILQSATAGV